MEMCKDCIHEEVCLIRAFAKLPSRANKINLSECSNFETKKQKVDIYKIADRITETVKQVVLANLRMICDNEGD